MHKEMQINEKRAKHLIPWLSLSVVAQLNVKEKAGLNLDATPSSDFAESEHQPLASKSPLKVKIKVEEGKNQELLK